MASNHGRRLSFREAINQLNVIAATALGLFFMVSVVMVGLGSPIIDFLEAHRFLPTTISFLLMGIAFLSSGTRDVSSYHSAEKAYVLIVMFLMLMFAWPPFAAAVGAYGPLGALAFLLVMSAATAILSR